YQQQYQQQYQQYQQTQSVPGMEPVIPASGGAGEGGGTALPPPIEPTAPQSALELIVDNSLAAIANAFKKLGF
ncbi:hypothetical protein HY415_00500, partial [Candidatus Kaiserbacteria bacterium]|nr:hypothetical protein [Candidatus Kaiserbacteria bacterium]